MCYALAVYAGLGVPRSLPAAAALFRQSAEKGHPQAQYNLGTMLARGEGATAGPDPGAAAVWWELAARQGHVLAQHALAEHHAAAAAAAVAEGRAAYAARLRTLVAGRGEFDRCCLLRRLEIARGQVPDERPFLRGHI